MLKIFEDGLTEAKSRVLKYFLSEEELGSEEGDVLVLLLSLLLGAISGVGIGIVIWKIGI